MQLPSVTWLQLEVSDIERSARWYRRMLGLKPPRPAPPPRDGVALLQSPAFRLSLVAGTSSRARAFRFGLHLASRAEVRAWQAHLDHNGGMPAPIQERDGIYGFTVADPDGYVMEFGSDAPEGRIG